MSYDYKSPTDLVKWCKVQMNNPNYYKNGGIGRYDGQYRQFDCCGLFKCFMWHDYHTNNAAYYNKTQKDLNCEGLIAEAKEKGPISTIPEVPGVLVYQKGHMGIYIGNGEVIESTAAQFDGKNSKIYKTYFKGNHTGYKRDTWTHWFKSPNLNYNDEVIEEEPITLKYKKDDKVLVNGSLYRDSKGNGKGKELINHVGIITITNNDYNTTKPYHIDDLGWVSEINITPYEDIVIEEPSEEIPDDYNEEYFEDNIRNNPLLAAINTLIELLKKLFGVK